MKIIDMSIKLGVLFVEQLANITITLSFQKPGITYV